MAQFYFKIEHYPGKTSTKWAFWIARRELIPLPSGGTHGFQSFSEQLYTVVYSAGHNSENEAVEAALDFLSKSEMRAERIK
jgi:hypothetical protein